MAKYKIENIKDRDVLSILKGVLFALTLALVGSAAAGLKMGIWQTLVFVAVRTVAIWAAICSIQIIYAAVMGGKWFFVKKTLHVESVWPFIVGFVVPQIPFMNVGIECGFWGKIALLVTFFVLFAPYIVFAVRYQKNVVEATLSARTTQPQ